MPHGGLVSVASHYSASETMERLLAALKKRDLAVFARVDHAAGAAAVGMPLRPTEVVLFGNPKGGTALMQDQQVAGIDLPLRALVWQDNAGNVQASYTDPVFLAERFALPEELRANIAVQQNAIEKCSHALPKWVVMFILHPVRRQPFPALAGGCG